MLAEQFLQRLRMPKQRGWHKRIALGFGGAVAVLFVIGKPVPEREQFTTMAESEME